MPLLAKLVRRPIEVAVCAAALVVLTQLNPASAAPKAVSPGVLAAPGGTAYLDAVAADNPTNLWRLNDTVAGTAVDSAGTDNLTVDASVTRGAVGPLINETSTASTFSGSGSVPAATSRSITGLQSFSVEAWFKTSSTTGGKIIGFGSSRTGNSMDYDRHLYLTNAGRLTFGVFPTTYRHLTSPLTYNDGKWHQVVGSMDSTGMDLFVDGRWVGHDTSTAGAELFSGYWRIGGDNLSGWPNAPTKFSFTGSLADIAVYPAPLSLDRVKAHYLASGRSVDQGSKPADGYGAAVYGDNPSIYWRLNETGGTNAKDEMTGDSRSATYSSGTVLGDPGSSAHPAGTSIRFPGTSAQMVSSNLQVSNPSVYSLETWFKTTSTQGGRLIGFGNSRTGTSTSYDRHIYMLDSGRLRYGIHTTATMAIDSPLSYNDGQWHHVVATQGAGGQELFVDGERVATGAAVTPRAYTGYWRLGSDRLWASATSESLAGSLDEAAIYPSVLSAASAQEHYRLGKPTPLNEPPTAAFTSTVSKLKVSFDAADSADSDGTIASYAWDFGDGETGTGVSPVHNYSAAGSYTVVLTVKDDDDATTLVSHDVTVTANSAPAAAFSSECTDLDCTFDAAAATDSDGSIAAYAWDFGDGASATGVTPSHSYTSAGSYDVVLTITDDDGATNAITQAVTVAARNNPPTAVLTADCTDLDCTFDGTGSSDTDGADPGNPDQGNGIVSYAWDFGDGRSGSASRGTHSYAEAGVYSVTLTVTDDKGATGSASIVVTAVAPNQPPVARFTATCTDLDCGFDAAGASDSDGSVTEYAWDFGDNTTGTGVSPSHTYAAGTYTVTLKVTDDDGASDTITHEVTAVEPNRPPVAKFTSNVTNLSVAFDATSSTDADGTIASYAWDFGDGSNGTGVTATHKYAAEGDYEVTVTVTDDDGATGTASATITATDPIVAADTFTRAVTSGLGTAEIGGAWTVTGSAVTTSVVDGTGRISVGAARTNTFKLNAVASRDTDLLHTLWLEQMPSGGGASLWTTGRSTGSGDYRVRLNIAPLGTMTAQLVKVVGTTETVLTTAVTVPGGNYTVNQQLRIRIQVFGAAPTTIRAKIWQATGTEPTAWLASTTDSTAGMQQAGAVGLATNLLGSSTASIIRIDNVRAAERTSLVTNPSP